MDAILTKVIVDAAGLALVGLVVWFFWLSKPKGVTAAVGAGGLQEALIVVKGGYHPDVVVVKAGRPVRLNFLRRETSACSDMVVFPELEKSAALPPEETVTVELAPVQPGEYQFQCQMGMLRGKLVAE